MSMIRLGLRPVLRVLGHESLVLSPTREAIFLPNIGLNRASRARTREEKVTGFSGFGLAAMGPRVVRWGFGSPTPWRALAVILSASGHGLDVGRGPPCW